MFPYLGWSQCPFIYLFFINFVCLCRLSTSENLKRFSFVFNMVFFFFPLLLLLRFLFLFLLHFPFLICVVRYPLLYIISSSFSPLYLSLIFLHHRQSMKHILCFLSVPWSFLYYQSFLLLLFFLLVLLPSISLFYIRHWLSFQSSLVSSPFPLARPVVFFNFVFFLLLCN